MGIATTGRMHHRAILDALPAGGTLLYCGPRDGARLLEEAIPAGSSLSNLTIEQVVEGHANDCGGRFDVLVVDDAPPRPGLLHPLRSVLTSGGIFFLEHAQHACYDAEKRDYRDHGSIGPDPGTDSHLWFGGA